MSAERSGATAFPLVLALAVGAAVLLRAEYLRELMLSPFSRHLLMDSEWYHQAAKATLEGRTLPDALFRPPLYPWFLAGLYTFFGENPWSARIVQAFLGVLQVVLCYRIADRTHGPRAAALTAWLAATYGMFAYYEGEILTTALGSFLTTAATFLVLEGDEQDHQGLRAAGGLALGMAALAHASALPLIAVAVFWTWGRSRRWLPALVVAAGFAIPVGGVVLARSASSGELVLATQGGINFYIGNNAQADGKSALAPGLAEAGQVVRSGEGYRDTMEVAAQTLAERDLGRELSAGQVSRYWVGRGLEWFRDRPKDAIVLLFRKFVYFWNGFEISNERDLRDQARRFTPILGIFLLQWTVLLPFALLGLARTARGSKSRALLAALIGVQMLVVIAFFVCARFRLPVVPWLLPFAAAGILAAFEDARNALDRPRVAARTGVLLLVFFLATNARVVTALGIADVTREVDAPFHRFNLAVLFDREGDVDRAIQEYRAAASSGVRDPRVHLNLGNALAATGRYDEATSEYREVLRLAPDYESAVRANLGVIAAQQQDWAESIRQFRESLALDPRQRTALLGLGPACLNAGRFDDAIVAFRRALAADVGAQPPLRRSLAVAYLESGLVEEARHEAEHAMRLAPGDVHGLIVRGRVSVYEGKLTEAERYFAEARKLAPGAPAVEHAIQEAKHARQASTVPPSP